MSDTDAVNPPTGRVTRAREKQRREEAGIPADPPKPKRQTLGKYLADEREKEKDALLEKEIISEFEEYSNYKKEAVLKKFVAVEVDEQFKAQYYRATNVEDGPQLLFLTLQTGEHPKDFTHWCNNTSLRWHLADLKINSRSVNFRLPSVVMLFVRGEHVQGTSLTSAEFKYVGIVGMQSVSSGSLDRSYSSDSYIYLDGRLVFDYVLSKKDLSHFGDNVMRCKKNKYGCSLCN